MKPILLTTALAILLSACTEAPQEGAADLPDAMPVGSEVSTGEACGGMAGVTCAEPADYCMIEMQHMCGAADHMGTCTAKPDMCTQEYDPVCGCDGETYSNACMAAAEGVSVAATGECE